MKVVGKILHRLRPPGGPTRGHQNRKEASFTFRIYDPLKSRLCVRVPPLLLHLVYKVPIKSDTLTSYQTPWSITQNQDTYVNVSATMSSCDYRDDNDWNYNSFAAILMWVSFGFCKKFI